MYSRNGQTRKHTTGQNKRDSNTQVKPELRVAGVLGEILVGVLESLHDIAKRHGQRGHDGREGVEEAEEGESSNAHWRQREKERRSWPGQAPECGKMKKVSV